MRRTKLGYDIRSVGFNPTAAECAGINAAKNTVLAMAISGALSGVAGAYLSLEHAHYFVKGISAGRGGFSAYCLYRFP